MLQHLLLLLIMILDEQFWYSSRKSILSYDKLFLIILIKDLFPNLIFQNILIYMIPLKNQTNLHIGSFSVIEQNVVLGENVFIGNGVKINAGCVIGDNSVIYDNVVLYDNTFIGENCIINAGTVIGSDGFGYHTIANEHHKIPHIKSVIIGNDVEIGAACTIDRGSVQNTTIADFCKFDNQVHIAHNVSIGKACLLAGGVFIGG